MCPFKASGAHGPLTWGRMNMQPLYNMAGTRFASALAFTAFMVLVAPLALFELISEQRRLHPLPPFTSLVDACARLDAASRVRTSLRCRRGCLALTGAQSRLCAVAGWHGDFRT